MDSSKKEKLPLIKECANRAKLSEHQVKHWINNYKSKISGRISARKAKSKLIRKRSGFNMFARESLLKESSDSRCDAFKNLGQQWTEMTDDEKQQYKTRALLCEKDVSSSSNDVKAKKNYK
ncbi:Hypothetical predicted protein [Paramuricea clavata]|uniref:Uncharacterized protein n=1 Tax=Paramuricea clavata TaxID=317549 RepID=A0A7D9ELE7_PARCT|nr:Hypothetical predicted protein [Paramuricea clavata]